MDKRSLIAIVMTIIVLLGWQMLIVKPQQEEALRQRRAIELERLAADSLSAGEARETGDAAATTAEEADGGALTAANGKTTPGAAAIGAAVFEAGGGTPITFTIVTETMRVRLTSRGGEIASVELLGFEGVGGGPVELVREGRQGGLAVSLVEDDRNEILSGLVFMAEVDGRPAEDGREYVAGGDGVRVGFLLEAADGDFVRKTLRFGGGGYEVGLEVAVRREGALSGTDAYVLSWGCGLAFTEKDIKWDRRQSASLGRVGDENYKESLGGFGKTGRREHEGMVVWGGARNKYFLSAAIPGQKRSGSLALVGDKETDFIGWEISYSFRGDPRLVEDDYTIYLGPLDMDLLGAYGIGLERTIDLGWMRFLSVWVLRLMTFMSRFIPNYGLIIIILSVLTKVIFYRLTHKSTKSMKDMQRLQPKIKELQEKYKGDKEKMNQEMMKLYKEAGVNPLGGCLPLLLQMPVFIALYNVLRNTIELRGAPFVSWINDLASPDVLFEFGAKLPFIGSEFHLLPLLMGGAMYVQSKLGGSSTGDGVPQAQTKMMTTMMPIVFTFVFYSMPSGLVLYWLVNNILTIAQTWYVHRQIEAEDMAAAGGTAAAGKPSK